MTQPQFLQRLQRLHDALATLDERCVESKANLHPEHYMDAVLRLELCCGVLGDLIETIERKEVMK